MPDPRALVADLYRDFAAELADAAGEAIRPWFRAPLEVAAKADGSPVTEADRAAERAMRERIADRFPQHGIVGEEYGSEGVDAEWVWTLDPIDGTGAFVSGVPTFGTLIGLLCERKPVLGLIDQPVQRERWIGSVFPDLPVDSTYQSHNIHTSSTSELGKATGFATTPHQFRGQAETAFSRLRGGLRRVRYGIDCYAYGLLASGYIDLVAEADLKSWDYLALVPIVRGAGGTMTDWSGAALTLESGDQVLASATPALHRAALRQLDGSLESPATR